MLSRADWKREFESCALAESAADSNGAAEICDRGFDGVETNAPAGDVRDISFC